MFLIRPPALLLVAVLAAAFTSTGFARTTHVRAAGAAAQVRGTPTLVNHPTEEIPHVATDVNAVAHDFNEWIDAVEQSDQVSGLAVAIVKDEKILLQRGIGYADATTAAPITPDSVFRLASLSKAFATALTAMLVDEGMLSWDTHVVGVLPTFELQNVAASEKLTVRDILSQRAGLPHNTYDRLLEADEPYQALVERLREVPMACNVGDCYGYQNITFALIGDITYAVSGDFFYHQVEKRLFHPLGMDTATYGRAALESSASWARLPAALLTTLHTPLVETPGERRATPWRSARLRDASYALGWRVYDYAGETLVFHAGAVQGYRSMIAFFPKYRFGAVMLWNCECAMPSGLMPMLLDRYLGLREVDWAGIQTPKSAHLVAGGSH